jgi:hypothetical protein
MRHQQNLLRYLAATAVLAIGSASAATVYLKPLTTGGPNPVQIRQLAERVQQQQPEPELILIVPTPVRRPAPSTRNAVSVRPRKRAAPAPKPPAPVETRTPAEIAKAAAEAAVKQIALMGVTQHGEEASAWLVDLSTNEREVAESGESAFGFTIKEVGAETVLLAQGDEEFTLHLGEKPIPVTEPEPTPDLANTPNRDGRFGRGRGNWGGGGNNGGWRGSGGGGGWRSSGGSGGYRGSFGGGFSGGGNRNGGGNRGFSGTSQRSFGGFSGGFGGGFQGNSANRGNQSYLLPTANPQEARRRNSRLMGGSTPLPEPAAISNPQTRRRRGTNSGRAFGANTNQR